MMSRLTRGAVRIRTWGLNAMRRSWTGTSEGRSRQREGIDLALPPVFRPNQEVSS